MSKILRDEIRNNGLTNEWVMDRLDLTPDLLSDYLTGAHNWTIMEIVAIDAISIELQAIKSIKRKSL